jgi:sugar lactone lactonase YvrE
VETAMNLRFALLASVIQPAQASAPAPRSTLRYRIETVAGCGEEGFSGDGGPASAARLLGPTAVSLDSAGNFYVADASNHRIRKIDAKGIITTFAGTGDPGHSGDGGPAAAARLSHPYGVRVAPDGSVLIADQGNHCVRRVEADGTIRTIAGTGVSGLSGDGGPAVEAMLECPDDVVVDLDGTIYIADADSRRVRKVTPDGLISTYAGGGRRGESGDGGPATAATLQPVALALDDAGNLYVADLENHRVRMITTEGTIHTLAGTGRRGFDEDGIPADSARLSEPCGVVFDCEGCLLIADSGNCRIRRIEPDGTISTVAGNGTRGFGGDGGAAERAMIAIPDILAADERGRIYVADHRNHRIRRLTPMDDEE